MHPALSLAAIPLLPFFAGLVCRTLSANHAGRVATLAAGASALVATAAAIAGVLTGDGELTNAGLLKLDVVSGVMVVLVSFLGTVVLRFSRHYLAGDPAQAKFFSWMSLTLAAVLTVVLSGHLLLLLAAWVSTSLCLHRLLLHHPHRAGAVFSARKKFVFSRLGDLCMLAGALVLHRSYGTWYLDDIFNAISGGKTVGLPLAGLCLAGCAALKSAMFPFHSWLPDTMETPTPVSAFMHAGIINAGGFLIVRFSPLFAHAHAALNVLVVLGTVTAAFGAVVMLAQPSVKRSLAYSTIAQMGFMILQCGLGAYGLALIHIVAHSLYKAHAFLSAGSTIGVVPRAAILLKLPALSLGLLVGGLIAVGGSTVLHVLAPTLPTQSVVFVVVLALALAYGLARAWSAGGGAPLVLQSVCAAAAVASFGFALHAVAGYLQPVEPSAITPNVLLGFVAAVFAGLFIFQAFLWRTRQHAIVRQIYVHALNGFYVGTIANRLLGQLWPRHKVS